MELSASIFKAYDIRGVVGVDLSEDAAFTRGQAIGAEAAARGETTVVVGYDGRLSGPSLSAALVAGLRASGRARSAEVVRSRGLVGDSRP